MGSRAESWKEKILLRSTTEGQSTKEKNEKQDSGMQKEKIVIGNTTDG